MALHDRIRELRKAQGLSQEAVARRADVSLGVINRLEKGHITDPHYSTLLGLVDALGVSSIDELLGEVVPVGKAPAPPSFAEATTGLVRAAEAHARLGVRLAEVLEPGLEERDSQWLTRVELLLRDYGVVLQEILAHVTLPDRDTAELIVAKGMDLNSFYFRIEEARAKKHSNAHA